MAYSPASWLKLTFSSLSCAAKPITRSRHTARPIAMRSDSWRGFCSSSRAARTAGLSSSLSGGVCIDAQNYHVRALSAANVTHVVSVAFVCPGQGSQYVGMGRALIDVSPAAADVFAEADEALAEPITPLCFDGPEEDLNLTVSAQPAILAASIAYLAAVEERTGDIIPAFFAGHSMGQYSAMVAADVLSLGDGMRLVRERGVQRQASAEGGARAAVIGLPDDQIGRLIDAGSAVGSFTVANRNSPGQIVV